MLSVKQNYINFRSPCKISWQLVSEKEGLTLKSQKKNVRKINDRKKTEEPQYANALSALTIV